MMQLVSIRWSVINIRYLSLRRRICEVVFFLTLPGPEDMMQAFDYMLETAQAVSRNLGGDVLDESRSVMTRQTLEHCRQQIRDLERRMLASTAR